MRMKALTEGARALLYYCAGQVDRGTLGDQSAKLRAEVLVPLVKAWGTDVGIEVAGIGVQVHGGMGFIEETGAAQHWRGTNGIQAADLVTRKLGLEAGGVVQSLIADIVRDSSDEPQLQALAQDCVAIAQWMTSEASLDDRLAGSVPFCTMFAVAVAGWQLKRQAGAVAQGAAPALERTKPVTARFFLERIVPEASGLKVAATAGADLLYALPAEAFAS